MKNLIITILLVFVTFSSVKAQKSEIETTVQTYFAEMRKGNIGVSLDYMYPKLFEIVPKNFLENALEQMDNDLGNSYGFIDSHVDKISEPIKVKHEKFALVDYGFTMFFKVTDLIENLVDSKDTLDTLNEAYLKNLNDTYKLMYGNDNVTYNENNKTFIIKTSNQMLAIKNLTEEKLGWKFLEKKEQYKGIYNDLFPKKIIKKFLK